MIQTDCLEAVKAIQEPFLMNLSSALIRCIHYLLVSIRLWELQHILRDYNKIDDCMAKMTFDTNYSLKVFTKIPREVLAISTFVQKRDNLVQSFLVYLI
ncbi:hypothetical protein Gohar_017369 [Gossypium harknessii]|uniref:RNase H type-1 domain-containing protein n=2 Tax=Gossypium TaxID=3633 RepID=A0A7J9G715_9ROSI|nr:hypothetical protein [Gossypium harknessii]